MDGLLPRPHPDAAACRQWARIRRGSERIANASRPGSARRRHAGGWSHVECPDRTTGWLPTILGPLIGLKISHVDLVPIPMELAPAVGYDSPACHALPRTLPPCWSHANDARFFRKIADVPGRGCDAPRVCVRSAGPSRTTRPRSSSQDPAHPRRASLLVPLRQEWRRRSSSTEGRPSQRRRQRAALKPARPPTVYFVKAIHYGDPDLKMPPKGKLPADVIADFEPLDRRGAVDPRRQGDEDGRHRFRQGPALLVVREAEDAEGPR